MNTDTTNPTMTPETTTEPVVETTLDELAETEETEMEGDDLGDSDTTEDADAIKSLFAPPTDEEFRASNPLLDRYKLLASKIACGVPLTPEEATIVGALAERFVFVTKYADGLARLILQIVSSNEPSREAYEALVKKSATPSCDYSTFAQLNAAIEDRFALLSKFEDRLASTFEFAALGCGIESR